MRFLLLFLTLLLQFNVSGYNAYNLKENNLQKTLTSENQKFNTCNDRHFRYQGQYFDEETNLGYNRFRYIDYDTGIYISQDPIKLAGNNPTLYGYVNDINSWIDEFGLDCHHIATNKHKDWSNDYRELFKKNGVGQFKNGNWRKDVLNDPLNKVNVLGHKGPHPEAMHREIYRRLSAASDIGPSAFRSELKALGQEAQTVGSWLNKILTKT